MNKIALAASAAFVAVVSVVPAAQAEPWKIRIGWATTPNHMQPIIDELQRRHPDLFHHFGKSYVAEGERFRGSTPQIQALAINELEIAAFGPEALALAVNNARLDVRMVADVFQDGVPGYSSVTYVVKSDSPYPQGRGSARQEHRDQRHRLVRRFRRCASSCASTGFPTATSPRSKPISRTCRRCSTTARSI